MPDSHDHINSSDEFSLTRRVAFGAVAFVVMTVLAFLIAEGLLRVLPIPGLAYQTFYYDPLTGGYHYPNSTVAYRGWDGAEVERKVNDWGFLDVDHRVEKPAGVTRIGFFGDSYTEARQVELDQTFFRRVQTTLDGNYEVLAFGVAGRSTLQSYLECTRWMDRADIDIVVYVFSENDPGDQLREVTGVDVIPYAELSGDSFVVDDAFQSRYAYKTSRLHRLLQFLKARSLVMSTIEQRLRLLRRHGMALEQREKDGDAGANDVTAREAGLRATAPSTWPPELVSYARTLGERIILRWRDDVEAAGRRFVIARIPRESQLSRPVEEQDAWAPWLEEVCERNRIQLIDPTEAFRGAVASGRSPYGDHLTPLGHRLFAQTLLDDLNLQ
jgi:hypothetical protein